MLKTNVRYTYPAVQRRDCTPPVGTGLAPLRRPIQLKKLRLTTEEDRNGREQKVVDNIMPKFYATLWGQHFSGVVGNNKSTAGSRRRRSGARSEPTFCDSSRNTPLGNGWWPRDGHNIRENKKASGIYVIYLREK